MCLSLTYGNYEREREKENGVFKQYIVIHKYNAKYNLFLFC